MRRHLRVASDEVWRAGRTVGCGMVAVALATPAAHAHELWPGAPGPIDAALHLMLAPDLALMTAATAVLASEPDRAGGVVRVAAVCAVAVLIGLEAQPLLLAWPPLWRWPLLAALALGLLLATGIRVGAGTTLALMGLAAATVGLGLPRTTIGLGGLFESWLGATLLLVCAVGAMRLLRSRAPTGIARIAIRVAGAWIAAIAALGLAAGYR